jgi:hypothetical protein
MHGGISFTSGECREEAGKEGGRVDDDDDDASCVGTQLWFYLGFLTPSKVR